MLVLSLYEGHRKWAMLSRLMAAEQEQVNSMEKHILDRDEIENVVQKWLEMDDKVPD